MSHLPESNVIPPMPYVPEFERDDMKTVKLKHVAGLVTREKKVPIFSGKEGIEGLLLVEEAVREAFLYLRVTDGNDMFKLYIEALSGGAMRKWNNIITTLGAAARTEASFNTCIESFYERYVDDKARNNMYDYLKTKECSKPFKATIADHVDRLEELYRFSFKLPGTVPALDDADPDDANQIKEHIFVTFPERWQEAFEDSHDVEMTSQVAITKYMNKQRIKDLKKAKKKERQDKQKQKGNGKTDKKEKNKNDNGHDGKRKKNSPGKWSNAKKQKKQIKPEDTCPIHGGHTWNNCFDNKHGPNFKPPRGDNGKGGERRPSERREFHYGDEFYHNERDGRRYHDNSARRAPSPLTWDDSHHYDGRYEGSARSTGGRYSSKSSYRSRT